MRLSVNFPGLNHVVSALLFLALMTLPVLMSPDLLAADAEPVAKAVKPIADDSPSGPGAYVMQLVASLAIVLLGIGALAWLLKRLNRLPNKGVAQMRVLAAMSLGTRERAVLVQVGDKQMLLGVSPGRVTTLHVFDDPVVDANAEKSGAGLGNNFAAILSGLGKGRDGGSR